MRTITTNCSLQDTVQTVQTAIDVEAAGYITESPGQGRSGQESLQSLKGKLWMIPKNFVELSHEVVGRGRFGSVIKARVHSSGGGVTACTTQQVSSQEGQEELLLHSLELSVRCGRHPNIVSLVGLCEELDSTVVVMELGQPSLKQFLLDCRALEHSPEFAASHSRFSSVREEALMELLAGLAGGLQHLASRGISHGALCARNVLMCGENSAKISGFGLSDWSKAGEIPDLTRWNSPETTVNRKSGIKADIWALGVVIWEAATLGGTPYCGVRTRDVMTRITRGLRLARPPGISDIFAQLMLTCWMLDPDERPEPGEVVESLQDMAHLTSHHLNFSLPPAHFRYEQYDPPSELAPLTDTAGSYV